MINGFAQSANIGVPHACPSLRVDRPLAPECGSFWNDLVGAKIPFPKIFTGQVKAAVLSSEQFQVSVRRIEVCGLAIGVLGK